MLIACWSPKGGSGTTVVAASLALLLARTSPGGVLLADLAGDVPGVLGLAEPSGPGLAEWLAAGDEVDAAALPRLELAAAPGLALLPCGPAGVAGVSAARAEVLLGALAGDPRPAVADCGTLPPGAEGPGLVLARGAGLSLAVLRPCYLALRRAVSAAIRPSAVVLVREPGRALGRADVEDVLGVPVRAEVDVDPAVARAVDAGLLASRLPRGLERSLWRAA